ncbi:hypothetical protein [Anabaena azotica]|uniref:Secreted protein n=1 Tax=Anabaena azotica FACHB-119 TaxID=947527 RepID=A0ABR8D6Y4_9NOST|nr:hypothetical protein [Anabaena azotica]MBD2502459.1 hypothetical protein [Anabaena azotica FACHB-119]
MTVLFLCNLAPLRLCVRQIHILIQQRRIFYVPDAQQLKGVRLSKVLCQDALNKMLFLCAFAPLRELNNLGY